MPDITMLEAMYGEDRQPRITTLGRCPMCDSKWWVLYRNPEDKTDIRETCLDCGHKGGTRDIPKGVDWNCNLTLDCKLNMSNWEFIYGNNEQYKFGDNLVADTRRLSPVGKKW